MPAVAIDLDSEPLCATCSEPVGAHGHQQRDELDGDLLDLYRCSGCCDGRCGDRLCAIESVRE